MQRGFPYMYLAGRLSLGCTQALDSVTTFRLYELYRSLCCLSTWAAEWTCDFKKQRNRKNRRKENECVNDMRSYLKEFAKLIRHSVASWALSHTHTHNILTLPFLIRNQYIASCSDCGRFIWIYIVMCVCVLPHNIMSNIMCIRCASRRKWHPEKRFNIETRRNTLAPMEKT